MNNYIDKRMLTYKRPMVRTGMRTSRPFKAEKGTPLTRISVIKNVLLECARFAAAIFLLFLSTFGGESKNSSGINVGKALKSILVYGVMLFVLWGALVVFGRVVEAVTVLPIWSLILFFAMAVLAAVGFVKE